MSVLGTSTKEESKIVKFVENNAPFAIFLGKNWIEKDQTQRKEEEAIEHKKKELKDFITRRIVHLIEEHEDKSKQLRTRDWVVEAEKT
jgi:hypothetical protein